MGEWGGEGEDEGQAHTVAIMRLSMLRWLEPRLAAITSTSSIKMMLGAAATAASNIALTCSPSDGLPRHVRASASTKAHLLLRLARNATNKFWRRHHLECYTEFTCDGLS